MNVSVVVTMKCEGVFLLERKIDRCGVKGNECVVGGSQKVCRTFKHLFRERLGLNLRPPCLEANLQSALPSLVPRYT